MAEKTAKPPKLTRRYTLHEEIGNATSHGVMAALTLFAIAPASIYAFVRGGASQAAGVAIFVICIFFLFIASTLYHVMAYDTRHKAVFQILDHIFIYVAIAGTYTPICITILGGWQGIVVLCIQWATVLFGALYKSISRRSIPKMSLTIYLVMGWTAVFFIPLLIRNASLIFIILIALGGVFYSAGTFFYTKKSIQFFHMIWHFFVNLGAIAHFIAIVWFLN